jgi:putative hydrolase of the HAD superfamily
MKIEAILFDLGGVFTDSPFGVMDEISLELGSTPERVLGIIFGAYHEDTDHPWHRLERGELSLENAREEIIAIGAKRGLEIDPFEVLQRMGSGGFEGRIPLVDRTRELRDQGYKTALVTNNFAEVRAGWRAMLPVDELFDVIVDSSEIGMRKPDPAIYHHALELLDAQAEHSVFLDDFAGNVDAAMRLGMQGIVVGPDIRAAIRELDALLGAK